MRGREREQRGGKGREREGGGGEQGSEEGGEIPVLIVPPILPPPQGKVTVKQAVLTDLPLGTKSLWKHKPCPFVYLYDKISGLDLCIDARLAMAHPSSLILSLSPSVKNLPFHLTFCPCLSLLFPSLLPLLSSSLFREYGNLGRFIRRSCSPNAELRHFFVNSEVHFGVYATHTISVREEITLPFDFRYEKCDYPSECACGQKSCPVLRLNRGKRRGRTDGGEKGGGYKGGEEREEEQIRCGCVWV